jgi:hypothetical protein
LFAILQIHNSIFLNSQDVFTNNLLIRSEVVEEAVPYQYECNKFDLHITNCSDVSPLSPLHKALQLASTLTQTKFSINSIDLSDVFIQAKETLSMLFNELQEGLVTKLLLPTEPVSPASPIKPLMEANRGDSRMIFLLNRASKEQDCWHDSKLVPQCCKPVTSFDNSMPCNGSYDESPNTVVCSHEPQLYSSYSNLPSYFPRNTTMMHDNNLQPISPICGNEDVTSVHLRRIQVYIEPPLQKFLEEKSFTGCFPLIVIVDYAIKIQNKTSASNSSKDIPEDFFNVGSAKISCPSSVHMPQLSPKVLMGEIILTSSSKTAVIKTFEIIATLDYDFIITELMRVISLHLRTLFRS